MEVSLPNLEKNYKLEKELGRGGMGIVYLATDIRLERNVAVKVLSISAMNESPDLSKRDMIEIFKTEAKAVARLNNPNIVAIYDIGDDNDSYYMVMEYVDGPVLSSIISETTQNIYLGINLILQICKALEIAHKNHIVHRDIKPANIIVSSDGTAKLMDFGIAQLGGGKSSEQLMSNQMDSMLGSIMYSSPEQLCSAGVDERSDIYSLGVSLYELLTGNFPFQAESISDVILNILSNPPVPPTVYNHQISPEIEALILKAISKDPEHRFRSVEEMRMALSFVSQESIFEHDFSKMAKNKPHVEKNKGTKKLEVNKLVKNDALIKSLETDWFWIKNIVKQWKSYDSNLDIKKVFENILNQTFLDNMLSGALVINEDTYIFIYEGYFMGAVNVSENFINNEVFENLPEEITKIELKIPTPDEKDAPLIVSSILNYDKPNQINLDSSEIDLSPLIDNMVAKDSDFYGYLKCYTNTNIFYYGFSNGEQIFYTPSDLDDDSIPENTYKDIKKMIKNKGILLNTYTMRPNVIGPSVCSILNNSNVNIKYKEYTKADLPKAVDIGNDEIPSYLVKEIKNNLYFDIELNRREQLKILTKEIDLKNLLQNSMYYKFCEWLLNDFFFDINSSGNSNNLKYIYSSLGLLEKFDFFEKLKDEKGNIIDKANSISFDILGFGKIKGEHDKKYNIVISFGNGTKKDLNRFLEKIEDAKKISKRHDFYSAFYVSSHDFESDALKLFNEKATEYKKGFLSFDNSKYKAYVKSGTGKGYQLCLFKSNIKENSFKLIVPNIL